MSLSIVTRGYGAYGRTNAVLRRGYSGYTGLPEPPATGYQYTELVMGVAWDSNSVPYGLDPPVVTGDVMITPLQTLPNLRDVLPQSDGGLDFALLGDPSRQILSAVDIFDVSELAFYGAADLSVNGIAPLAPDPGTTFIFPLNIGITPVDLTPYATSPYGDIVTVETVDSMPQGTNVTNSSLGGTPTLKANNLAHIFRTSDPYGLSTDWTADILIGFTLGGTTLPDGSLRRRRRFSYVTRHTQQLAA